MAVRGVLAQADVRQEEQLGEARAELPQRALDDAVLVPGSRPLVVLPVGDPEEDHGADPAAEHALGLAGDVGDGVPGHGRQGLVRLGALGDEQGQHEVGEVEAHLADEVPERRRPPEPPQPRRRKRAHDRHCTP